MSNYYLIENGEDGEIYLTVFHEKKELQDHLLEQDEERSQGCRNPVDFISSITGQHNLLQIRNSFRMVIKGEILTPTPEKVVTQYSVD